MTPIESEYDIRFLTLLFLAVDSLGELAVEKGEGIDTLLVKSLFRVTKQIHEKGEDAVIERILRNFPILKEVID